MEGSADGVHGSGGRLQPRRHASGTPAMRVRAAVRFVVRRRFMETRGARVLVEEGVKIWEVGVGVVLPSH